MFSTTEITSHELVSDNPIHQRLVFAYLAAAGMIRGEILEIGCGVGRGLDILAGNCEKYTAIDKNKKLIQLLSQKYPDFNFMEAHIPPLSNLPDNSFDFVLSFQVIEHIKKDHLFVKEIHRVLKPGGKAILTTPNSKLSLTRNPWHIREYTARELEQLMRKYFDTLECFGVEGNEKVAAYFEANKKAVEKITRWDILQLQYLLPRRLLQIPYDLLNRLNRRNLHKKNHQLVNHIGYEDYFLSKMPEQSLDLFYIAEK